MTVSEAAQVHTSAVTSESLKKQERHAAMRCTSTASKLLNDSCKHDSASSMMDEEVSLRIRSKMMLKRV
jgi:hypothetical protein